ncbi:MAG: Ppx/GppA family phosphatase [Acidimicrobiia bacterium]|nr:Ppx/GppA family phosphatase [Acidimicrobiia bacterium]
MRVSVLDLGSNSFRLLVADAGLGRTITPVARDREMLHLGAVVARNGTIPPEDLDRAVAAVKRLADMAVRAGAEQGHVVGTSALRSAANGDEVLRSLSRAAGSEIVLLDGAEEAYLSFLGVRAAVALRGKRLSVLDLGGGAMEIVVGGPDGVEWSESADVGVSRLHAECSVGDAMDEEAVDRVRALVDERFGHLLAGRSMARRVVAVGGSIRALAHVVADRTMHWLPPSLNQLPIELAQVSDLRAELTPMTAEERVAAGVKTSRADHIGVAAVVVERALQLLGASGFELSDWGLREGLVLDTYGGHSISSGKKLRRSEVGRVRDTFSPDGPDHASLVARLAVELFDATTTIHGLGRADRDLLEFGALLHDIGRSLSVKGFHKHSAYLLENAEIRGFSPLEVALLVSLVRFSRTGETKGSFEPLAALPPEWQARLEKLLALFVVVDAIDWARSGQIDQVDISVGPGTVAIQPVGDRSSLRPEVVDSAIKRFQAVFGTTVSFSL